MWQCFGSLRKRSSARTKMESIRQSPQEGDQLVVGAWSQMAFCGHWAQLHSKREILVSDKI